MVDPLHYTQLRRALYDKPLVACNACRRVLAPWRFMKRAGLRENSDDGDYRAMWWRWFLQSAAGPADSSMIARWRFGWGAVRSMGTGDYICATLRGGAPWGFSLREGEGDTYRPLLVSQVSMQSFSLCTFIKISFVKKKRAMPYFCYIWSFWALQINSWTCHRLNPIDSPVWLTSVSMAEVFIKCCWVM